MGKKYDDIDGLLSDLKSDIQEILQHEVLDEVKDMEKTIDRIGDFTYLEYTKDVMQIMTDIRKQWGMTYPEEEK